MLRVFTIICLLIFSVCTPDPSRISDVVYVRNDDSDMPAYIYGNRHSKEFIVVLHGGPGGSGLEYRAGLFSEILEDRYVVVYWDQRGQGMSQGKYFPRNVTINQLTQDLHALVRVLRHKYGQSISIFLYGHSWGGTLGTNYLLTQNYQENISGWIESNGAHDILRLNQSALIMFQEIGAEQIALGHGVEEWERIIRQAKVISSSAEVTTAQGITINELAYEAEELLAKYGVISYVNEVGLYGIHHPTNFLTSLLSGAITNYLLEEEVERYSATDRLHKITIPSLFLWGKYDFVVPPQLGIDAFARVSSTQKELVIFEKSGHSPMLNEPLEYTRKIVAFIDRHK